MPYAEYDVIVYLAGFSFDAESSIKLGGEEYFYIQSSNFTLDGFIQATATTYEDRTLATYAVFSGLTSDSFTLESIKRGGNRPAIAGFQIVAIPEPGSLALMAIGCVVLIAFGRRARARRT